MCEYTNQNDLKHSMQAIDLTGPAPIQVPQRQYFFIQKARQDVMEKSEELGRPLYFHCVTFGCQMI